jgi:hypothetical protein
LVALIFEAGSLLFLGFDIGFAYGLALGTAVSVVNFNILAYTSRKLLNNGYVWMSFAGYIVRLVVYGFAFYAALRVNLVAAFGSALGFLTLKLAIYYVHGVRAPRKTYAEGTLVTFPPQKKPRRKGIMKDIFGSREWDEDEDGDDTEDGDDPDGGSKE